MYAIIVHIVTQQNRRLIYDLVRNYWAVKGSQLR